MKMLRKMKLMLLLLAVVFMVLIQISYHMTTTSQKSTNHIDDSSNLTYKQINQLESRIYINTRTGGDQSKQRYLIYNCDGKSGPCGGLFDQLKGVMTGYLISQLTDRVFLIEMTSTSCKLSSYLSPNKVAWNNTIPKNVLTKLTKSRKYFVDSVTFYKGVATYDFQELFKEDVIYFRANLDYIDNLKLNVNYKSKLKWMENRTRDKIYQNIFHDLFKISDKIQLILDDFLERAKPRAAKNSSLVCAHIRTGRNPTIPRDSKVISTTEDVKNGLRFLHQKVCEISKNRSQSCLNETSTGSNFYKHVKVFVSSDSYDVLETVRQEFKMEIVENKGVIVHVELGRQHKNICEGFEKLVSDFLILTKCDVLLLSKSGLSRMASYIRGGSNGLYCNIKNKGVQKCEVEKLKSLYKVKG
ncbi:uncharacterized protein LOC126827557 [Patella vulgata]|uniref:uncharacterized protein LOC126827557 n=1 Tax=Patella vulgata TaxID=6465 RepID=UPI0024A99B60|nr:uncharacterized protein LOC126827557 [Patella vulgata]